jgi:hypothetical protein
LPEGWFAVAFEYGGDAEPGVFFDAHVEILKTPGKLTGEQGSNRAFAAPHETGEAQYAGWGLTPSR